MKNLSITAATISLVLGLSIHAHAEQSNREEFHKAMEACIAETGVTKTEKGTRPSEEDRQKVDTCLAGKGFNKEDRPRGQGRSPEHKAAFVACISELGLTRPQRGEKPSDSDREKLHACLQTKGVDIPQLD